MNFDLNLKLSQEQKLVMTQQMQLSIKLLQMSSFELKEFVDGEYEENPMLEGNFDLVNEEKKEIDKIDYKELIKYLEFDSYGSNNYKDYSNEDEVSPFNFISEQRTLKSYLHEQVIGLEDNEFIKSIVGYMIDNTDHRGYLDISNEEICRDLNITIEECLEALEILQELEPNGVGARSLRECLIIQLRNKGILDDILEKIINDYLNEVAGNKFANIAKELKISPKEAQDYGDIIKSLEPKPSRGFFTGEEVKFVIPDAQIKNIDGEYFVIMNENIVPRLSISNIYKQIINTSKGDKLEEYVKEKMNSALFLIKSIEQRKTTLQGVLEKIVVRQKEYFQKGEKYLKPMTMKEIAEELDIHESTVSRAIKEKYVLTANGTLRIKDLFANGLAVGDGNEDIAVVNIKKRIKELVDKEEKKKPLSDQNICNILQEEKVNISRRTVAKYREELEIPSSSKRKRL